MQDILESKDFKDMLILAVDDVEENLKVLSGFLFGKGFRVETALDGKSVLKIAAASRPDLIILDIHMPGMDGFEVCERLKTDPVMREIPVIFIASSVETDDIVKGFKSGAVDYITRPFKQEEVLARVLTHLKLKKALDVINRKNELLEEKNTQLAELDAIKNKFFSIISHDLRTPFCGILGFSKLLIDVIDDLNKDEIIEYATQIYDSGEELNAILDNLLEWAKTQIHTFKYEPEVLPVRPAANEIVKLYKLISAKKGIAVIVDVDENLKAWYDVNMFLAIMRNLVSNAIKFTDNKGIIKISARLEDNFLKVSVTDNGKGVDPQKLNNLFQLDLRASRGTAGEKGTGLGLTLCREFAEKSGGVISAKSEPGKGSEFTFTIPQKQPGEKRG